MVQKIIKIGSSIGITIPRKSAEELGLAVGDSVEFSVNKEHKRITIEPALSVDTETVQWARSFIERYRPALKALAKQ
jgi:antitoxin component of MazEF toxin-antitoxin module